MTQTLTGYNATTRMMHVTRACGCQADISVKGIQEARFCQQWLSDKKCNQCEQEQEKLIALNEKYNQEDQQAAEFYNLMAEAQ